MEKKMGLEWQNCDVETGFLSTEGRMMDSAICNDRFLTAQSNARAKQMSRKTARTGLLIDFAFVFLFR